MANTVVNVTGQPLRYIVTKNSNSIKFLKNSGSLIVYEPTNAYSYINDPELDDSYREIWVASYFLAGGYGAKSRPEQNKLSYIANNYDDDINLINYNINTYAYNLKNAIDDLNKRKVTRGINENTNKESDSEYDISYNVFKFGDENILLSELYEKLEHVQVLSKLEISNIIYDVICYNDNNIYHNNDNIPIDNQIKSITITLSGNNKDSGGINKISINLYSQGDENPNTPVYPTPVYQLLLDNIQNIQSTNQILNTNFQYSLSKDYGNIIYKINEGLNTPLDSIILDINASKDVQSINKLPAEKRFLSNDTYGLKLYGVKNIKYIFSDNNEQIDISNYLITPLTNHPLYSTCLIAKIKINNNTTNVVSILINENYGRLINCEFVDNISNNIYNITNLKKVNQRNNYYEYSWIIGQNIEFDNEINPGFISKNVANNLLVFNEGEFILTFSKQLSNIHILNDTFIGNYWVSGEE